MQRYTLPAFVMLLFFVASSPSQNADFREELAFAEALRQRGDNDLALEIIAKLRKTAPPELAKELSLEEAKTRLRAATDETETAKRLKMYREAREDFQRFIDANPEHPRVAEANLDIARLLNLAGRTELNQVYLAEDSKSKKETAARARDTLIAAATKLEAASKALTAMRDALPDPDNVEDAVKKKAAAAARAKVEREINDIEVDRGLNLYDQASTYLDDFGPASKKLTEALKVLTPLQGLADGDPSKWKAQAWIGRITHQVQTADKARNELYKVLIKTESAATFDGIRLAKYFMMLVQREQPEDKYKEKPPLLITHLINEGVKWRGKYPKHRATPEGTGVTFMLAQTYLTSADAAKDRNFAAQQRLKARGLLRELEQTENEYTERARRMKFRLIAMSGDFAKRIEDLITFEDCFIRAQYEAYQMNETVDDLQAQLKRLDPAPITDPKEKLTVEAEKRRVESELKKLKEDPEKKRKGHIENIIKVLGRGLAAKEVETLKSQDVDTARSLVTYWALQTNKHEEAIKHGEDFARKSPRASQAAMSAVYALQAYSKLMEQKQGAKDEAEVRARAVAFAQYMEDRWPGELAGELASHIMALQMIREDNPREAIKKLSLISPGYASYTLTRFQLADAALKADRENLEPIEGDRAGDYRKRAMLALESMPASSLGGDSITNYLYMAGKAMYGRDLYRFKRFAQMDTLADELLPNIDKYKFSDDDAKDAAAKAQLRFELTSLKLYARYGLADAAAQAKDHAKAAELLDKLIDDVSKADDSAEKKVLQQDKRLADPLLYTALRTNLLLGKIERTEAALTAMGKVGEDATSAVTTLRQLAFLIRTQVDDLRKGNDETTLKTAITGYTKLLDNQIAKQAKGELKPDFIRVLAECYSNMGEHSKAAAELGKIPDPKAKPGTDEEKQFRNVTLALLRELRMSKDKANYKKGRDMLEAIRGDVGGKAGWGRQDLRAMIEHGFYLELEEKWNDAFRHWGDAKLGLVTQLRKAITKSEQHKELFLECYFHMLFCGLKIADAKPSKEERDKEVLAVARQMASFEDSWENFGSDASKKRFADWLKAEPGLREQYEAIKKKKK